MTLYERIETLRKSKNISQGKLEKELGFSNGSISKWKNSTPTTERLQKLADYFGVTVEYLLTGEEAESEELDNSEAEETYMPLVFNTEIETKYERNRIVFGAPGTGKPVPHGFEALLADILLSRYPLRYTAPVPMSGGSDRSNAAQASIFRFPYGR